MQVTVFGYIWFVVLLIASFRNTKAITKCVFFSAIMQAGSMASIGEASLTPLIFSCVVYIIRYVILHGRRMKLRFPTYVKMLIFYIIVILITSLISSSAFKGMGYVESSNYFRQLHYNGHIAWWSMFFLLIYATTALIMYNSPRMESRDIHQLISGCVWFVAVIGVWQYLTLLHIFPSTIIDKIIYSNEVTDSMTFVYQMASSRLGLLRFYSTFMEPSYSAGFLSMAFYYYISQKKSTLFDKITIFAILIMTILTFSATAYAAIALTGILAVLVSRKIKISVSIIGKGIILILIAVTFISILDMWDIFREQIINKMSSGSAHIRGNWNSNCIDVFKKTHGFGIGYGVTRGSSLAYTLPASIGIQGTIAYILFALSIALYSYKNKGQICDTTYSMMFISVTFADIIAIGIFGYTIRWASILLFSTANAYCQETVSADCCKLNHMHQEAYDE